MRLQYNNQHISLIYFQKLLQETYNNRVIVSGEYYESFNTLYGLGHYIYKYLNYSFPIPEKYAKDGEIDLNTDVVSISTYFANDNNGHRLDYTDDTYLKTYNPYQRGNELGTISKKYIDINDVPIGYELIDGSVKKVAMKIDTIKPYKIEKGVFEIDDVVASYLFGRTITPWSTREDIYYAQRLILGDGNVPERIKGLWTYGEYDLTDNIVEFQRRICALNDKNTVSNNKLLITGYFDVFTEARALQNGGIDYNGIHGL